jgi:hypothetical protein
LQFAIGTALDCKLQSTNCKGQIERSASLRPYFFTVRSKIEMAALVSSVT